nr:group II intron reverse transcriptase/maturase [Pseudomonas sp. UBA6718]
MTGAAVSAAGATSASESGQGASPWNQVDWYKANQEVKRLQARIVKAVKANNWSRVKRLQWVLTHSYSAKVLAVRRVTENRGKKTPGVDKETWSTPKAKWDALARLKRRGYKPSPLRRVYIPKSNGKLRPLGIPTMIDRAMQALYKMALEPVLETRADKNSYGFRPERGTADAIEQLWINLNQKGSAKWVLEGDIKGCFDFISHDWLIQNVPMDSSIVRKWLKCGVIDKNVFGDTSAGTPQGGVISPLLANCALDGLEERLMKKFGNRVTNTRKYLKHKVNYVRYADDFVITGSSRELLTDEVLPLVQEFMRERGLELQMEKTKVTHVRDGFDFLGQNIRMYEGKQARKWSKCLVTPSSKNVTTFLDKVRKIIGENKTAKQEDLIFRLNPIIRGWANFHRSVTAKKVFSWVDAQIFKALWKWARRRHPAKGLRWVKDRYFPRRGGRDWNFGYKTGMKLKDGKDQIFSLVYASGVAIVRHTKIKGDANPYDPEWNQYFDQRIGVKMAKTLAGRRKLTYMWRMQGGICPVCKEKINSITGWHVHHKIRRTDGGSDAVDNLVLLHPTCHHQVHHGGLSFSFQPGDNQSPCDIAA